MTQKSLQIATFGHAQSLAEAIPGYSANDAADEDNTQVTTTLIPSQAGVEIPCLAQRSPGTDNGEKCACLVCLEVGIAHSSCRDTYHCRFANCDWVTKAYPGWSWLRIATTEHEKAHYTQDSGKSGTLYHCLVENCHFTSKRWYDLQRHTRAKHCSNPTKFACSVIGCKYHGEGNGFTRKDKLIAHYKSMHQGQKIPGKAARTIKPAPASPYAEASGSSSMSAQGE